MSIESTDLAKVITPELATVAGQITATSLQLAEHFGKLHKDVLRAIRNMECSAEFNGRNFAPVDYIDEKGESRPMYRITRDGFAFLAMSFTGKEAAGLHQRLQRDGGQAAGPLRRAAA